MFIGHLPAGYIFSKKIAHQLEAKGIKPKLLLWVGTMGAIAPDLDLFYFYLIDNRQHHHHTYWPHYPSVWFSLFLFSIIWFVCSKNKTKAILGLVFSANGIIHMLLDTIVGDIWWFAPFVDQPYVIFKVPALYNPWWLNFILHWSFSLELLILFWAIFLWRRKSSKH